MTQEFFPSSTEKALLVIVEGPEGLPILKIFTSNASVLNDLLKGNGSPDRFAR
jgi:hypothetical protein